MRRWLSLLLLVALAACAGSAPQPPEAVSTIQADVVQPGEVCRVGTDGGPVAGKDPVVAERGIGGTGAPATWLMTARQTIIPSVPGQTGGQAGGEEVADRGIGGTGIVGVVTGFASICVNGLEVQYDAMVPVDIDGQAGTTTQLRAGHVVAIHATGPADAPKATAISIVTAVAGPIEAVELDSGAVVVAGQRVMVSPSVWGANRFGVGDWTAVSGLRQADGTIVASRLDSAQPNKLIVRGPVSLEGGTPHIGLLALDGPAATLHAGDMVVASGSYSHGAAHIVTVAPDGLSSNPTSYFGAAVNRVVVQAFVRVSHGTIWLNDHLHVPAAAGVQADSATAGNAIVSLERGPDGSFTATSLRYTGYRGRVGAESSAMPATSVLASLSQPLDLRSIPIPPAPVSSPAADTASPATPMITTPTAASVPVAVAPNPAPAGPSETTGAAGAASPQGGEPSLIISGTASPVLTSSALVLTSGASAGTGASDGGSTSMTKTVMKPIASGTGHTIR